MVGAQFVVLAAVVGAYQLLMRVPIFRREMRKFQKLSRRGPFYRLGVWVVRRGVRRVLGDNAYVEPTIPPKPTHTRRTTESIAVTWRCHQPSKWVVDELWVDATVDGAPRPVEIDGDSATVRDLEPGTSVVFRARTVNPKGASPWSKELELRAHQEPVDGGGEGPNYVWKQTSKQIQVMCAVPPGTRGRDVQVQFASATFSVAVKGEEAPLFDKAQLLFKALKPDECTWELVADPHPHLLLTLEKLEPTLG
ncbi:hypothetical protein CTAYLR_005350 [Chrysophaeum taylorii]|uniref:Fibronectin type-III domain-containing protein n=1 Tax=Chrysophaeum taylorii TaxID=2483200 RepID=A0AAD7U8W3_9STRA|nr:hypothetical protein CTAYLR_005350 [Chrysophaeum taylorii]